MKKTKKFLSVILVIALLFSSMPLSANIGDLFSLKASAAELASGVCGDTLAWTLDGNGTLTIDGSGEMYDYPYTGAPWKEGFKEQIKTVVINDGVTYIGNYAFTGCGQITNASIPNSVSIIGERAFEDCGSLKSIIIPDNVTTIGRCAFYNCASLESISLSKNLQSIEYRTFYNCNTLKSITIFDNTETIEVDAFINCSSLTEIIISENNLNYSSQDGVLFNKDKTELLRYPEGKTNADKTYVIPDSVKTIAGYSFQGCNSVEKVVIPDGIETILSGTFLHCTGIKSVVIPTSVNNIESYTFFGCSNLTDVYYMGSEEQWASVTTDSNNDEFVNANLIFFVAAKGTCGANLSWEFTNDGTLTISGTGAMDDYSWSSDTPWYTYRAQLKKVVLEHGVTNIGSSAFEYCSEITEIIIPNSVTKIGYMSFNGCNKISSITIPESVIEIDPTALVIALEEITVDDKNPKYSSENGVLFNKDKTELLSYPRRKQENSYVIPDGVKATADYAFYYCTNLKNIVIPDGVTDIGEDCFSQCTGIENIVLPDSVVNIGESAFLNCDSLKTFTVPSGVTIINVNTFTNCSNLESVVLPAGLTKIYAQVFYNCDKLTNVYFAGTKEQWDSIDIATLNNEPLTNANIITFVAEGAISGNIKWSLNNNGKLTISGTGAMDDYFTGHDTPWYAYHEQIKEVVIEDGVTSIGSAAFEFCSEITSVTIPNSVTKIGALAFDGCSKLSSITIPESVIDVVPSALLADLEEIIVDENNPKYLSDDGILFNKDKTELVSYPRKKQSDTYVIPHSVTSIGDYAFYSCINLKNVTIPHSVTTIGLYSFYDCSKITNIVIPESVVSIGSGAFSNCYSLTNVTIPKSVTSIKSHTFSNCDQLKSVVFYDSVTKISSQAFYNSNWISDIYFVGTKEQLNSVDIGYNNGSFTTANIICTVVAKGVSEDNLKWLLDNNGKLTISGSGKMKDYSPELKAPWHDYSAQIKEVVLYEGVTSIGSYAFDSCSEITSITIPNSVTKIGAHAFDGCGKLSSLIIPKGVIDIDSTALLIDLEEITVDEKNTKYSSNNGVLFNKDKTKIVSFPKKKQSDTYVIPDSVMTIGDYAFYSCQNLKNITIPDGVVNIGNYAFNNCKFTNITIPGSVTKIGNYAFDGCALTDVHYIGAENQWKNITIGSNNEPLTNANITYTYVVQGSCGENLSWFLDEEGVLTISGTGDMDEYNPMYLVPWYDYRSSIKKIVIEDGVTSLCDWAFYSIDSLTEITLPSSVTRIGVGAFCGSENLKDITIPDSVTFIGDRAFQACDGLTNVYYIGTEAQWNDITIDVNNGDLLNANITYAISATGLCGDELTWKFNELTGTLIISGYGDMYDYSETDRAPWYDLRTQIKEVVLEDGVMSVGEYAFDGFTSLSKLNIKYYWMEIRPNAFNNCTSLKEIHYDYTYEDWQWFVAINENNNSLNNVEHIYTNEMSIDPTCTNEGRKDGTYCIICKEYVSGGEATPATGVHKGGEATCVSAAICTVCKQPYGKLKETNHKNTEIISAFPATCTLAGFTGDTYCLDCKKTVKSGETIPTSGHTEEILPAVEPTGTTTGLTEGKKCSVCGKILVEQQVIPMLGVTVSGTVETFSDGVDNSDVTTIEFFLDNTDTPAYTTTVEGSGVLEYSINAVAEGTYTVKVSKQNHATREYTLFVGTENVTQDMKIHLFGDIDGNGEVRMNDLSRINAHVKETSLLTGYALACADIDSNGDVRMNDLSRVNAHVKETSYLWK